MDTAVPQLVTHYNNNIASYKPVPSRIPRPSPVAHRDPLTYSFAETCFKAFIWGGGGGEEERDGTVTSRAATKNCSANCRGGCRGPRSRLTLGERGGFSEREGARGPNPGCPGCAACPPTRVPGGGCPARWGSPRLGGGGKPPSSTPLQQRLQLRRKKQKRRKKKKRGGGKKSQINK